MVAFVCLLVPGLTSADGSIPDTIGDVLDELGRNRQFNGAVLVARDGEILFEGAHGLANFETGESLTVRSSFQLASLSKPFTATCIMVLAEQGSLGYDDRVGDHLPGFPYGKVTIRQLLNHTSGVPEYEKLFRDGGWPGPDTLTNEVLAAMFQERKPSLDFPPGSQYLYSNTGYVYLARLIEAVSGLSYAGFLRENIWGPLGMENSFDFGELRQQGNTPEVFGYDLLPTGEVERIDLDRDLTSGSSGLCSSVGDVLKFDQALYTERLVTKETLDEAFSPVLLPDSTTSDYGFGWDIWADGAIVLHSGGSEGIRALLIRFIEKRETLIILENHTNGYFSDIAGVLMNVLAGEPYEVPEKKVAIEIDPEVYELLVGTYDFDSGFRITVTREGDRLFAQGKNQQNFAIFPESETTFFYMLMDAKLTFNTEETGSVSGLILHQGGEDSPARKVK
jgi:CubicO group peptidase (beta-lactamase class C family)